MEVHQEEALIGSKHMMFKGKRTKRQRTMSHPFLSTMATTTSSSCSSGGEAIGGGVFGDHIIHYSSSGFDHVTTSPSNSGELTQSSVEEEDMANCLILLAQGHAQKSTQPNHLTVTTTITTKSSSVVHDVYQCKTCNRSFPSFQALGGHRASHKKPKPILEEGIPTALSLGGHQESSVGISIKDEDTTLSLQIPSSRDLCSTNNSNNNKSRVHECSMCGAEFSSGQALGGHMRRHRPLRPMVTSTSSNDEGSHEEAVKKPRTLLSLDLNLPAASDQVDDDYSRESEFPFASSKEQVIVFSASHHPLVDCHY